MVVIIDPQVAGISGDMLLCSLVDLGADKNKIIDGVWINNNTKWIINKPLFDKRTRCFIQTVTAIKKNDIHLHDKTLKNDMMKIKLFYDQFKCNSY